MNLISRKYKFAGHSDAELYSSIPSIEGRFGAIVDGNNDPVNLFTTIQYDSDESNETDTDAAMGIQGWEALDPQP